MDSQPLVCRRFGIYSCLFYLIHCILQVYANEVGFDGSPEAFLTYSFFETVMPPNSPMGLDQNRQNLITFTFNSQQMEGVVLVLQNRVRQ